MIIDAIFNIINFTLRTVLSVLPDVESLPVGFNNAFDWFTNQLAGLHYLIPFVDTLFNILTIVFLLELSILTLWIVNKIIGWVRG